MKEIKICYTPAANAGDAINPIILENVMGYKAICVDQFECAISGIGSGLRRFFVNPVDYENHDSEENEGNRKMVRNKRIILWAAGFLTTPSGFETPISDKIIVSSVRGYLSKKYVEQILKKELKCSVGDGGILVSKLLKKPARPDYQLGIIPHLREKDLWKNYIELTRGISDTIVIDIAQDNVMRCVDLISRCKCIISASLHGLIFADSFLIPNKHVIMSDRLIGDGFKFRDYYSVYGLEDHPQDLRVDKRINIKEISDDYGLNEAIMKDRQEEVIDAFHRYL